MSHAIRLVLVLGLTANACGDSSGEGATSAVDPTCRAAQPLVATAYHGMTLRPKELALTFDDGPASRTSELSAYLASEGIHVGFFVNGKNLPANPGVLANVVANGHVVGNHTQDHFDLTDQVAFPPSASGDAKLVTELTATDTLIAPFIPAGRFLFRAPYGAFDSRDYSVLHTSAMNKYVGHIHWDIGGIRSATAAADWACWQNSPQLTTKACGDLYLEDVQRIGRGIVLMHDADYGNSANHSLTSGLGNTVDMVKYLVPILKARGYTFVRVDEVPAIARALPPLALGDAGTDSSSATDASTSLDASHAPSGPTSMPDGSPPPGKSAFSSSPDPCGNVATPPTRSADAH
jgi:peptidoglycan/xylan/chitin deacetylase (PgdA/CDA1 family)